MLNPTEWLKELVKARPSHREVKKKVKNGKISMVKMIKAKAKDRSNRSLGLLPRELTQRPS